MKDSKNFNLFDEYSEIVKKSKKAEILINIDRKIVSLNKPFLKLFEFKEESIANKDIVDVLLKNEKLLQEIQNYSIINTKLSKENGEKIFVEIIMSKICSFEKVEGFILSFGKM